MIYLILLCGVVKSLRTKLDYVLEDKPSNSAPIIHVPTPITTYVTEETHWLKRFPSEQCMGGFLVIFVLFFTNIENHRVCNWKLFHLLLGTKSYVFKNEFLCFSCLSVLLVTNIIWKCAVWKKYVASLSLRFTEYSSQELYSYVANLLTYSIFIV